MGGLKYRNVGHLDRLTLNSSLDRNAYVGQPRLLSHYKLERACRVAFIGSFIRKMDRFSTTFETYNFHGVLYISLSATNTGSALTTCNTGSVASFDMHHRNKYTSFSSLNIVKSNLGIFWCTSLSLMTLCLSLVNSDGHAWLVSDQWTQPSHAVDARPQVYPVLQGLCVLFIRAIYSCLLWPLLRSFLAFFVQPRNAIGYD